MDFYSKLYRGHSLESDDTTLRLVHLNLSKNHIAVIPSEILDISTLQVLDISANRLGDTSPDVSDGFVHISGIYLGVMKSNYSMNPSGSVLQR
jgi:Leucine-rich repeat (LRR) protein